MCKMLLTGLCLTSEGTSSREIPISGVVAREAFSEFNELRQIMRIQVQLVEVDQVGHSFTAWVGSAYISGRESATVPGLRTGAKLNKTSHTSKANQGSLH